MHKQKKEGVNKKGREKEKSGQMQKVERFY
jgi:hypothetical protein